MKKILFFFAFLFGVSLGYTQTSSHPTLFAQCKIDIENEQEMRDLQTQMRQNPEAKIVRLDWNTQRAFILTQGIDTLSDAEFKNWFGIYSNKVHCIQIGVHGVDPINPYPFQNCQD